MSPQLRMLKANPQVMVLGGEASGRCLDLKVECTGRGQRSYKTDPREPLLACEVTVSRQHLRTRKLAPADTGSAPASSFQSCEK